MARRRHMGCCRGGGRGLVKKNGWVLVRPSIEDTRVWGCRETGVQPYKATSEQGYKDTRVQQYEDERLRGTRT